MMIGIYRKSWKHHGRRKNSSCLQKGRMLIKNAQASWKWLARSAKLIFAEIWPIEGFYVEINLRKRKWLILSFYNRKNQALSKSIDLSSTSYENFLLMRDFNADLDNAVLKDFCNLTNLVNKATCYENQKNRSALTF